MNASVDFEMVCDDCGSLAVKIENPEQASREAIIYCADCGAWRGTMGALRDLAVRPDAQVLPTRQRRPMVKSYGELVSLHNEIQSLRQKVQMMESIARTEK